MLSAETLRYVGYVTKFGCKVRFLPFHLRQTGKNGEILEIRRFEGYDWALWLSYSLTGAFFCLLKLLVLGYSLSSIGPSEDLVLFDLLFVVAFSYGFVFHLNTIMYGKEVGDFFNHTNRFNSLLKRQLGHTGPDGLEHYVRFFFIITILFMIIIAPYQYFGFGSSKVQNLYTVLGGRSESGRILYCYIEYIVATGYFTIAVFYNFLLVGSVYSMDYWLGRLRYDKIGLKKRRQLFRRRLSIYKGIGLVNHLYYESCSIVLASVGLVLVSGILILSSFALLKYSGGLGLSGILIAATLALMTSTILAFCCRTCASAKEKSEQFKEKLKYASFNRTNSRFVRQLAPLRVSLGIFFYLSKSTLLTVLTNCVSVLITLLLSF